MKTPCILTRAAAFGLAVGALVPFAVAQTTTQATPPPAQAAPQVQSEGPETNEVVTLPAFDVTGDAAHGYIASESTTGTRIASRLSELPFDVDVVTTPFLRDFAEYDLNSQLAFIPGFSPSEVTGQFQLRGFASPVVMVDGFRRIGLVDVVDIERIEVIKGPAASIYGAIQPGGAVNIITPQPTTTQTGAFEVDGGSYNLLRESLEFSGPLNKSGTLFYRISAANEFTNYAEAFASHNQSFLSGKLLYKPSSKTSVSIDLEHTERREHPFNQVLTITEKQTMPWAGNSVTESQYYGMAVTNLLDYDFGGPESANSYRVTSATLALEHIFNDVWSLKFGANAFTNPYFDQLVGSGAYYPYGTGNVTVVNGVVTNAFTPEVKDQPQVDWKPQRGGGSQLDNLFKFNLGPISNKLLVTADYYEVSQRLLTKVPTVNGSQATDYYALYSAYNPSGASYYTPQTTWSAATLGYGWNTTLYGQNPALYNAVTADNWTAAGDYGLFASERASMFGDRLILLAGGRWDYVRNQVKNYNIPEVGVPSALVTVEPTPYQAFDYNTSAWTYQLGATFKVTKNLNLYANKSTAFNPQPQIDSSTGLALPNNTSDGYEYGVKANFFGERLNFTIDRFLIDEYNLAQTETDPVTSERDTILSGEQQAKGYEFDTNFQVTNDLLIFGDWGYTDTKVLNSDVITFLNDLPARRVPRDNVGMGIRYEISHGFAKGLFFVADGRYSSKSLVNLGSGKSIIPGPAGTTVGATSTMYYVAATNTTYANGKDPKITGEQKITGTPFNNVPFPGNGVLPYPSQPSGELINFPMSVSGIPLPLKSATTPGIYVGEPEGVFVDDGRQNNYNAPYAVFDLGMGYHWTMQRTANSTFQINLKNILNRQYTWASGVPGFPFEIIASYHLDF